MERTTQMRFLRTLIIEKSEDLSKLPKDVMTAIKSNIRKGAEDLQQKWANALELVHKAYEIEGVQRPTPDMDSAWKQYEENLQYAVQQLAEARGMDDDWRMSSSMFHEALHQPKYQIKFTSKDISESFIYEGYNPVKFIKENMDDYTIITDSHTSTDHTVHFSKWGINKPLTLRINRID